MPFAPHFRATAIGTLGSGADRFSYGINLPPLAGTPDASQVDVAAIAAAFKAFHTRATSFISSAAVLTEVKVAAIGADGKYLSDPVSVPVTGGAGASPAASTTLPQTAWAISLLTDRRGPSGKGRFYVPMPQVGVIASNGFQVEADNTLSMTTSAATLLNALPNPVVASTKGFNEIVTGVRVGRVLDTIRTRRNALAENYGAVQPIT